MIKAKPKRKALKVRVARPGFDRPLVLWLPKGSRAKLQSADKNETQIIRELVAGYIARAA